MKFKHMVSALLAAALIVTAFYAVANQPADNRKGRADIIVIDSMAVFGDLERPGVLFPHDQHTDALEKQGKDCTTCHETRDGILVVKFKRVADIDQNTVLDIYHTNCITCHEETAVSDMKSGPLECGSCHQLDSETIIEQQVVDFDASLHQKHIEAIDNQCESCHHGYDPKHKTIAYVKGREESCSACHGEKLLDYATPNRLAKHHQCISCHQQKHTDKRIDNRLVAAAKCAGCHDQSQLMKISRLPSIPRLERNQPDITFVKSLEQLTRPMMNAVVFNHKMHETNVTSCSTCHHESLKSCEECHTLSGTKEGDGVTLAQAMHNAESERSCVGCHAIETKQKDCAGCHSLIKPKMHVSEGQSCQTCHSVSIERLDRDQAAGKSLKAANYRPSAKTKSVKDYEELPEELIIDVISNEYQGASFPHRSIVEAMMDDIADSDLAANFHQGRDVVCQSCHHNSPETMDPPPKCVSCHGTTKTSPAGNIPEMKAAYHQQCFNCHEALEMKNPVSTDCVACHSEKTKTAMKQ